MSLPGSQPYGDIDVSTALKSYGRDAVALGWIRRSASLWLYLLYMFLLISGFFSGGARWPQLLALAGLLLTATFVLGDRFLLRGTSVEDSGADGALGRLATGWDRACGDLEVGSLLILTTYAFLHIAGRLTADVYPVVYILIAFLVSFQDRRTAWTLVAMAVGIEVASFLAGLPVGGESLSSASLITHITFIAVFGALNAVFARVDLAKLRTAYKRKVALESKRLRQSARDLRLAVADAPEDGEPAAPRAEGQLIIDAIDAVDTSIDATLHLLKDGLSCHSVVMLWYDATGRRLRIRDSLSPRALADTLHPGEGALAGVLRRREPVVLNDLRRGYRGLVYYQQPDQIPVRCFCGVPLLDGEDVVGALCLDRTSEAPFTDAEVQVIGHAALSIVRTVQTERFFLSMERTRHEMSRFYEASRQLNHALTPDQVTDVALSCVRDLCRYDLAAVVLCRGDKERRSFEVVRADAASGDHRSERLSAFAASLQGLAFEENNGLVSMAVEMGHYLPYNGDFHEDRSIVFARKHPVKGISSLLVLPLHAHDEPIGAFVVACREAGAFPAARREMLEVIANQVAISLHNAHMYDRMEQMATTDGLTGLNNHRTFQNRMDEAIARTDRVRTPLSVLLTDIDHFKSINDTHGHPVGDEVLRQVAGTFRKVLRQTDIPARYGGEEFVVILEGTDREGAKQIAERLRTEIAALKFKSTHSEFSITMSFGVGLYPDDARDKAELIDRTDQSLYYAKSHGRNQVRAWHDVQHAPDLGAPKKDKH